ncbi:transglycosylase family protein, partial [Kitasatospora sp. NPDC090308]|uniref:transglycosylase family protein n=1 Tax=Kitasatospora sp. NPDC090308 TaxID=3364082 RepID=UPI003815D3A6
MSTSRQPRRSARSITALVIGTTLLAALPQSSAHAASVRTWDKVAQCESGGNWSINTDNALYGGLQITMQNWRYYGGTAYAARPDLATKQQQILIAEKILADQGAGAWTCAPGTGLDTDHADPYPSAPSTSGSGGLAAAATGNTVHVQLIGSNGSQYNNDGNYTTGTWSTWTRMDTSNLQSISAVAVGNVNHVFAVAADGGVYTRDADYNAGTWTNWVSVPGGAGGAKAVTAAATGSTVRLEIIGSDGSL